MNLNSLCGEVENVARSVGNFLKTEQHKLHLSEIQQKGIRNFVTYIDKDAEKQIVESLKGLIPEATFLTEEGTVSYAEGKYTWIIDPLDGTTNYVHGDTPYSVSIALMHEQEIVLGVVFDPISDEMYTAVKNGNATLNEKYINPSAQNSLTNAYIGFGIPYSLDEPGEIILKNTIEQFRTCSFRIKGSAAIEICYVACGRSDAYFHSGLAPWDVAAGAFILQCAGGKCSDFSRGNTYIFNKELVASNGHIHEEIMLKIIQN